MGEIIIELLKIEEKQIVFFKKYIYFELIITYFFIIND